MRKEQALPVVRLLFAIVLAGASAFSFSVARARAEGASQGKRVAYFQNAPTNPFTSKMMQAFVDRAKSHGMDVTVFASTFDPALQAQQIDDAIARKFDLLAVQPINDQAVVPPLLRAKKAGIPVVIVNTEPKEGTEDLFVAFIGESSRQMGKLAGEAIVDIIKTSGRESAKIALLTGPLQEEVVARRVATIKEAVAVDPKIQIVAIEDVKWDMANAERVAGQLYGRFAPQGGLDLIYGMADNVAIGALKAAEAANIPLGIAKGQLIVMGGACQPPGIAAIKAGKEYATGVQLPPRTGAGAADLAKDYFEGKTPGKMNYLEVDTVTKNNLDKWAERCSW